MIVLFNGMVTGLIEAYFVIFLVVYVLLTLIVRSDRKDPEIKIGIVGQVRERNQNETL